MRTLALRMATLEAHGRAERVLPHAESSVPFAAYSPSTWGENVGMAGTLLRIRTLWMGSAGHRANILKPAFRRIGIGVVKARGRDVGNRDLYGG